MTDQRPLWADNSKGPGSNLTRENFVLWLTEGLPPDVRDRLRERFGVTACTRAESPDIVRDE